MTYFDTFTDNELKKAYSYMTWKKAKRKFIECDKMELDTIKQALTDRRRKSYHGKN